MRDLINSIEGACKRLHLERVVIEPLRLITSRARYVLASVRTIKRRMSVPLVAIADAGQVTNQTPGS